MLSVHMGPPFAWVSPGRFPPDGIPTPATSCHQRAHPAPAPKGPSCPRMGSLVLPAAKHCWEVMSTFVVPATPEKL